MVGVTCEKCGATYRFDDADVPPSGKIIKCARCGTAITVMPTGADAMGMRTPASAPARTVFGLGPQQEPGKAPAPAASGVKVPSPTARKPASPAPPAADEVSWDHISAGDLVSLGKHEEDDELDLVAPVGPVPTRRADDRQAPDLLAPVGPKPTVRRPVGAAESPPEITDLPAPVGPTSKRQAAAAEPSVPDLLAPVGPLPRRNVPDLLTAGRADVEEEAAGRDRAGRDRADRPRPDGRAAGDGERAGARAGDPQGADRRRRRSPGAGRPAADQAAARPPDSGRPAADQGDRPAGAQGILRRRPPAEPIGRLEHRAAGAQGILRRRPPAQAPR